MEAYLLSPTFIEGDNKVYIFKNNSLTEATLTIADKTKLWLAGQRDETKSIPRMSDEKVIAYLLEVLNQDYHSVHVTELVAEAVTRLTLKNQTLGYSYSTIMMRNIFNNSNSPEVLVTSNSFKPLFANTYLLNYLDNGPTSLTDDINIFKSNLPAPNSSTLNNTYIGTIYNLSIDNLFANSYFTEVRLKSDTKPAFGVAQYYLHMVLGLVTGNADYASAIAKHICDTLKLRTKSDLKADIDSICNDTACMDKIAKIVNLM